VITFTSCFTTGRALGWGGIFAKIGGRKPLILGGRRPLILGGRRPLILGGRMPLILRNVSLTLGLYPTLKKEPLKLS